ncbi:hypothetical protein [Actinomadura flavalba]|uniref:hypothetical protein n=1 Tax=Actinomadura flavalba TaxID=1120938 RepID=UPI000399A2F2|nr:hypothetical protein [Actinomadura flavalba]
MIRNSRRVATLAVAGAVAIAPVISGCGAGMEPGSAMPSQLTEGVNVSVPRNAPQVDVRNMFLLGPKPDEKLTAGARVPLYASIVNRASQPDRLTAVRAPGSFSSLRIQGGAVTLPPASADGTGTLTSLAGEAEESASPSPRRPGEAQSPTPRASGEAREPSPRPTGEESEQPAEQQTERPTEQPTAQPSPPGGSHAATTGETARPSQTPAPTAGAKQPLVVLGGLSRDVVGGESVRITLVFERAGEVTVSVPVVPQQHEYAHYTAVTAGVPLPRPTETATHAPEEGAH